VSTEPGQLQYKPLSADEQAHVLDRRWPHFGLGASDDFATSEAVAAITRISSGMISPGAGEAV